MRCTFASPADFAWEKIEKTLRFVQRGRILLRCGSASRVIAALLGRFLPRLGPLAHRKRPFFLLCREMSFRNFSARHFEIFWHVIPGAKRTTAPNCAPENLEIPDLRFARSGMTE
jgi:hypothetical protein